MCGRFNLRLTPAELQAFFGLFRVPDFPVRYNIAPTQMVISIRLDSEQKRVADDSRWGLVPAWARGRKLSQPLTIARSESVATTRSFRDAFRERRCVIPASGYYEWPETSDKFKQPWHIFPASGEPFALAGLWEPGDPAEQTPVETCCMLTRNARDDLQLIHHRMPVMLTGDRIDAWLNPDATPDQLTELMADVPSFAIEQRRANPYVNSAKHEGPRCLEPATAVQQTLF